MKPRSRRIFGAIGIVAGVALVAFEVIQFSRSGPVERWFWLLVGVLVTILGAAEFMDEARGPDSK
jgi:hypothetical protein